MVRIRVHIAELDAVLEWVQVHQPRVAREVPAQPRQGLHAELCGRGHEAAHFLCAELTVRPVR